MHIRLYGGLPSFHCASVYLTVFEFISMLIRNCLRIGELLFRKHALHTSLALNVCIYVCLCICELRRYIIGFVWTYFSIFECGWKFTYARMHSNLKCVYDNLILWNRQIWKCEISIKREDFITNQRDTVNCHVQWTSIVVSDATIIIAPTNTNTIAGNNFNYTYQCIIPTQCIILSLSKSIHENYC